MQGASLSIQIKEIETGKTICSHDPDRLLTPASVLKIVTTATALDVLGADYRYPTSLEYDGILRDGVLQGDLYIKGSGDPSLGSSYLEADFLAGWVAALQKVGIRQITGSVIADESRFDTEGISPKWLREDLGNYYAAGSYGLSVFDNCYRLFLRSGAAGKRPTVVKTDPPMPLRFENRLNVFAGAADSVYIGGTPFDSVRSLYGTLPPNRDCLLVKGDIPDPPLFLAAYVTHQFQKQGIQVDGLPSCWRLEQRQGDRMQRKRIHLVTTYSPPLRKLVKVCNHVSHNLFADAFLKTVGIHLRQSDSRHSSFVRGSLAMKAYWEGNGLNAERQQIFDGSGLAPTDKLSASFLVDLLVYMATNSEASEAFIASLPVAGQDGSVRTFFKGTPLEGHARLKSGSMSAVRCYAGYLQQGGKQYALAIIVNNFEGKASLITKEIGKLLFQLIRDNSENN